jgi:hypothetical protein
LASSEACELPFEQISTDTTFFRTLKMSDEGDEETRMMMMMMMMVVVVVSTVMKLTHPRQLMRQLLI